MGKFSFGFIMVLLVSLLSAGTGLAQTPTIKCGLTTVLVWAPNTETDLDGYKTYSSDVATDLADVTGLTEFNDTDEATPQVNGMVQTVIELTRLVPEVDNYFTITAYDKSSNESLPSIVVKCDNNQVPGQVQGVTIINLP